MNKNEQLQFEQLSTFIKQAKENNHKTCIFLEHNNINHASEPYDAAVYMIDGTTKMVQLTQMSNTVFNSKGKFGDPTKAKFRLPIPKDANDTANQKYLEILKNKGISREITKHEKGKIFVTDEYQTFVTDDDNYEKDLELGGILNGLIRALKLKWTKYDLATKAEKSCLVIIDSSKMVFYKRPTINPNYLKVINETLEDSLKYDVDNYLTAVFFHAIDLVERELGKCNFFDEIQVYFHQTHSTDSEALFFMVSTNSENKYPLNHPFTNNVVSVAMTRTHKMAEIITKEEIEKFNRKENQEEDI